MSRIRAFTLVELLVVITLIAVLIAMLLPSLGKARASAQSLACMANLHGTGLAFTYYLADSREYFPVVCVSGGSVGNANTWCFLSSALGNQEVEGVGLLVRGKYTAPKAMFCPGHANHGDAYLRSTFDVNNITLGNWHAHSDYGVGWHSIINNAGGLRFSGSNFELTANGWWGQEYQNSAPYRPKLREYAEGWYRGSGKYYGSSALIADVVDTNNYGSNTGWCAALGDLQGHAPRDIPHLSNINTLGTDGTVKSISNGFADAAIGLGGTGVGYWDANWWEAVDGRMR